MTEDEKSMAPTEINGDLYYTIWQFAKIVKKSENAIYTLIYKGNKIRKLHQVRFFGKPLIPACELTDFPFALPGKGMSTYHYNEQGMQQETIPEGASDEY